MLVTPNLTPSPTGRITTDWDEDRFVGRFDAGRHSGHTHALAQFASMSDADKRAIYRYLRTLPPSDIDPGPSVESKRARNERERREAIAAATRQSVDPSTAIARAFAAHPPASQTAQARRKADIR